MFARIFQSTTKTVQRSPLTLFAHRQSQIQAQVHTQSQGNHEHTLDIDTEQYNEGPKSKTAEEECSVEEYNPAQFVGS